MPFACSICEQESQKICAFCTKDACDNHLCPRCGCCSDCCECDVPLDEAMPHPQAVPLTATELAETTGTLDSPEPAAASPESTQSETFAPAFDAPPAAPPPDPLDEV